MAQQYTADEITCEFIWVMDERRFAIRLISDHSISFRSFLDDGSPRSQRGQDHVWTERHGRWIILSGQCCHLILYFNYRGAGFRRDMAGFHEDTDAGFLEELD